MDEYHNQNRNSDEQANNQPPSSDSPYPQSGQTDGSQQWQQPNNLPDNRQPWQGELQNNQSYWQNGPSSHGKIDNKITNPLGRMDLKTTNPTGKTDLKITSPTGRMDLKIINPTGNSKGDSSIGNNLLDSKITWLWHL